MENISKSERKSKNKKISVVQWSQRAYEGIAKEWSVKKRS